MNRSVQACQEASWHLAVWNPADERATARHMCWRCRSWRHEGECRQWKGSQDFARVAESMKTRGPWTYIVLTFAQRDWPDWRKQYRQGMPFWSKLRKRITREWGKMEYIQTWERHVHGGLHVNIAVKNSLLFDSCVENWQGVRKNWLEPHAVACGFGFRTWIEPIDGTDGMAGYLTKLSRELTGSGEKSQIPYDAPPHFRRIRASQGTLPKPFKSDMTGKLVFCPLEAWIALSEPQRRRSCRLYFADHFAVINRRKKELACT